MIVPEYIYGWRLSDLAKHVWGPDNRVRDDVVKFNTTQIVLRCAAVSSAHFVVRSLALGRGVSKCG
jgi:hypothetical protein